MRHNLNNARAKYAEWGASFDEVMSYCHEEGWVIDVPHAFGIGWIYEDDGETILKVCYVEGDMSLLFRFGLIYKLDKIEFSRSYSSPDKRYSIERLAKLI